MNKRNRIIIIISTVFMLIAIAALLTGFTLSGTDVLGWLGSKQALLLYVCLGVYVFAIFLIVIVPSIMNKL